MADDIGEEVCDGWPTGGLSFAGVVAVGCGWLAAGVFEGDVFWTRTAFGATDGGRAGASKAAAPTPTIPAPTIPALEGDACEAAAGCVWEAGAWGEGEKVWLCPLGLVMTTVLVVLLTTTVLWMLL
jgi:hypothetical protein